MITTGIVAAMRIAFVSATLCATSIGTMDALHAQTKRTQKPSIIIGTVTDAGAPVEAANIYIGTAPKITHSALSDKGGRYSLAATGIQRGSTVVLSVRRIGYQAQTLSIKLDSDTVVADASLTRMVLGLEQIVVAAQAPARESRQLSFSTAAIATGPIAPTPSPAMPAYDAGLLHGKAAGVNIAAKKDVANRDDARRGEAYSREQYDRIEDNPFLSVRGNAMSTFSIDVDRASYGNMRRLINDGSAVPKDAIRIEELINYFPYKLSEPRGRDPIAITTEIAPAPWQRHHQLVRVALQARSINVANLPANNLVFLIDVSGSMSSPDKLPLVKQSLRLLVSQLREQDRVALVVYAGSAGLVLPGTSGAEKETIERAIDRLEAGGSTAGGAGIMLAYKTARENFIKEGNNRVILATDGDFNVGASSDGDMERLIEEKRAEGTYLTVLGFGRGNIQDAKMEKLAKKGNGNYAYVDNIEEARKTLVHEMGATLVTVANDVKLQVEFNPEAVRAYRLIGYEDRLLRNEDFNDDKKDAGDIGSGHTVTALYEVIPVGVTNTVKVREADSLRYVSNSDRRTPRAGSEMMFIKLRYKQPGESSSRLMTHPVRFASDDVRTTEDFRFAASVASFGMLLRKSEYKGSTTSEDVLAMAKGALGEDKGRYRSEFVKLVEKWQQSSAVASDRN